MSRTSSSANPAADPSASCSLGARSATSARHQACHRSSSSALSVASTCSETAATAAGQSPWHLSASAASGSSFYYSFRLLPEARRRAITALYAYCREVDDVVDEVHELAVAQAKLAWWRLEVAAIYDGTPQHPVGKALAPVVRDFDLKRRMFQYPCSYMIYTPAFDALPQLAKDAVYNRMWEVLSGREKQARYRVLSLADRRAVVEILRDTKPGLPDYFQPILN